MKMVLESLKSFNAESPNETNEQGMSHVKQTAMHTMWRASASWPLDSVPPMHARGVDGGIG
jgi:hypothetical protein